MYIIIILFNFIKLIIIYNLWLDLFLLMRVLKLNVTLNSEVISNRRTIPIIGRAFLLTPSEENAGLYS